MNLYNKHRPETFEDIMGNKETIDSLQTMINKKEHPHAYLFHGEYGCGKTTLGRILANSLGCKNNDFREIDSADFRGIDSIREIRKQSIYKPLESSCRVWLLDECHKLSNDAMNALLKALEDTPKHVYYILCTTEPQKLISTVRSRCQQFKVELLTEKQMSILLKRIIKKEGGEVNSKVLNQIIQDSLGHPRDAIQVLEKVLSVPEEKQLKIAKKAAETQNQVIELCRALLKMENWNKISSILKGIKNEDPEKIRLAVFGYCSSVLLNGKNNNAAIIMEEFQEPFFNNGFNGVVFACYSIICGA